MSKAAPYIPAEQHEVCKAECPNWVLCDHGYCRAHAFSYCLCRAGFVMRSSDE